MNNNRTTSNNGHSSNGQEQHQMVMFPVPPPAIPPQHAYSRVKQCPTVPFLMIRAPMQPVLLYGVPRTYEQTQFNFSYSSGNGISFPSNPELGVGQSPSVVSSFEFKMSSSVINDNKSNMSCPVLETETISNYETLPSCSESKSSAALDCLVEQFPELVKTALDGCKKAEALVTCHQKRPCFKKIDSLCARLKQDLVKADNVMSNINSQGLAWAVKDFIFVFTRIMNAWIIIKGYVSSKPDGLMSIQRELCPNFLIAFRHWHEATHELVQSLIKSFINLNKLAKQQRSGGNIFAKTEEQESVSGDGPNAGQTFRDIVEDIEETESLNLNTGAYIRAGVYPNVTCPPPGFPEKPPLLAYGSPTEHAQATEPIASLSPIGSEYSAMKRTCQGMDFLRKTSNECIEWVLGEVRSIEEGQYFYCLNFAKNYFPDFDLIAWDMIELRKVYKKHDAGQYKMVVELLDDLQQIVDTCRRYVEISTQFVIWNANGPVEENCTANQRIEWENFPKMLSFIVKMEHLLSKTRKGSTMADLGMNSPS
ncbi:protein mitoshell [Anopheles funestus]|uniref:protein mitoshell n=1 Tax=Anopheles funestus TaxID=62324 RepID=UPI0020C61DB1|nr:protein mitoshell [Anopheles funestus]